MPQRGFTYGGSTILSHPFLLVFTIVFAILQKSKILGDGKRQIDAIVSLIIGLLVISFAQATGIILQLIPFLAIALVVILVFMILIGSFTEEGKFFEHFPKRLRGALIILAVIAVVIVMVYITGFWENLLALLFFAGDSKIFINIIFIVIIIAAVAAVIWGAGKSSDKK